MEQQLPAKPAVGIEPTTARYSVERGRATSGADAGERPSESGYALDGEAPADGRTANKQPTCTRCGVVGVEHFGART